MYNTKKKTEDYFQKNWLAQKGLPESLPSSITSTPPTLVKETGKPFSIEPEIGITKNLKNLSFRGFNIIPTDNYLESRKVLFVNNDLHIGLAAPCQSMEDWFFKNADADEMIFVHVGSGQLKTIFGTINFEYGDYLIIPRGTIYQLIFDSADNHFLIVESFSPIETPNRYRNQYGQLMEHAPFCERDFKLPAKLETHDERGDFKIMIKKQGLIYPYVYETHPFDAVGWDGCFYPYAVSIFDFEPLTGRIHMPPPIHQQFQGNNFVICSFVPPPVRLPSRGNPCSLSPQQY